MRKTANEKLRLGVFVIIGLLLFIVAIYLIGERQNMFAKNFSISANFNNVNGLMQGNNVRYSGINVGTVKTILMLNDSTIRVDMFIDEKMKQHIKKDAIATIGTDGLVGNMIVNIIPGNGNGAPISAGDRIESYTKIGADDMLNTLNVTNENAALLTAKLLEVTNAITNGKGTVGMLINDTITANNIKETINNLKQVSIEVRKTVQQADSIITSINYKNSVVGVLLNDTIEANNIRRIISNYEASSDDVKAVIANLNETLTNFRSGDGAVNYLLNDSLFVRELEASIKNINEGTNKFNENMEALKHSFLTRRYFKKMERELKRTERKHNK
ncbi:MlaD family protein [Snuella sedimenti]|uniref:MCE family protein n=1 Tax=Snuella sedimenti TaxID=2798802 RepID=A0A8J7JAK1_9FLAO|nr:MlaD family protein [Snuella sedimenti]MBJ6367489.1 MCE family protein [Snuella sedimenti]